MKDNELIFTLKQENEHPKIEEKDLSSKIESITYDGNKGIISCKEDIKEILGPIFCNSDNVESIEIPACIEHMNWDNDKVLLKGPLASEDGKMIIKNGKLLCFSLGWGGTEVVIPEGVKEIGNNVLSNCYDLKKVTLPESLERIHDYAFSYCEKLGSIKFPKHLKYIGQNAFCYTNLGSLKITDEVTHIGSKAFNSCPKLKTITIGKKVETIEDGVFSDCPKLATFKGKYASDDGNFLIKDNKLIACTVKEDLLLPEGIVEIAPYSIMRRMMNSISLPSSLLKIGESAFAYTSIANITLPENLEEIGNSAFIFNDKIKSITIPDSVDKLGEGIFYECMFLKEFKGKYASKDGFYLVKDGILIAAVRNDIETHTVPEEVNIIGERAFSEVNMSGNLIISEGVIEIHKGAFMSNHFPSWDNILFPSSLKKIDEFAFKSLDLEGELNLPEGLIFIGGSAFESARIGNEILTIPTSVSEIGKSAFYGIRSKENSDKIVIKIQSETPPTLKNINTFGKGIKKILIPEKAKEKYQNAPIWNELSELIEFYN